MSDPDRRFAETVPVWTGGHIRMVGSAREAALKALEGTATAEVARKALIAAAKEDRIYMAGVRTK